LLGETKDFASLAASSSNAAVTALHQQAVGQAPSGPMQERGNKLQSPGDALRPTQLCCKGELGDEGSFTDFRQKLLFHYVEEQTANCKARVLKCLVQK
jgi:hypothetical protein